MCSSDLLMPAIGEGGHGAPRQQADGWEKGGQYSRMRQLYGILTREEPEASAPAAPAVTPEMAALAEQLKERVRQLIGQNQLEAALGAVRQLKEYFPGDEELAALEAQCVR